MQAIIDTTKVYNESQDFSYVLPTINEYWQQEFSDPNSIWFKDKIIEQEIKKIYPRAGRLMLAIAKCIKFSFLKGNKFYYTQQEMAEQFGTVQSRISESILNLEKITGIKFIKVPTKVVNPSKPKHSSGRWMPISLSLVKKFLESKLYPVSNKCIRFQDEVYPVSDQVYPVLSWIPNKNKDLQTPLCITYINTYINPNIFYKELKFFIKADVFPKLQKRNKLMFTFKNKKPIRYKLQAKEKIVCYKDYGLHPQYLRRKELINADQYKQLNACFEELIVNDFKPCLEETSSIIGYWNSLDSPKIVTHNNKININNKTFCELLIAISNKISKNISMDQIKNACSTFIKITKYHGKLKRVKKYRLLNFLLNEELFNSCLLPDDKAFGEVFSYKTPFEKTFDKIKQSYAKYFHHNSMKLARKEFDENYKLFVKFVNDSVDEHKTLYMYKYTVDQFINEYFSFVKERSSNWNNAPTTKTVLEMKSIFFRQMRNEPSFEYFGLEKERVKEIMKKKAEQQ